MGQIEKKHGTEIALLANPSKLPGKSSTNGDLMMECKNYSMVPMTLQVKTLGSDDLTVANPHLATTGTTFSIPRRPNKHLAVQPSVTSVPVGNWIAGVAATATVDAYAEALAPPGIFFFDVKPTSDVTVT